MDFFSIPLVEWFGYTASVIVAVSLTMNSLIRLRWYNLAGAGLFSTYGFIIGSLPVAFLNLFIVGANIFYLVKLYRSRDDFRVMSLSGSEDFLAYFLDSHREEIQKLFPKFSFDGNEDRQAFYLVKNTVPIGVLIGKNLEGSRFHIELDYVGPAYRDFKMGAHVYQADGFFARKGIRKLTADATGTAQDHYLKKMGFQVQGPLLEKIF